MGQDRTTQYHSGKSRVVPNLDSFLPDLKQDGKKPVPNAGTELGPGRGCSQKLGMGNVPDFFGKNLVPGKWHSGMQTSSVCTTWLYN